MDSNFKPDNSADNYERNIESLRFELAEKVRLNLEKYKDEIKDFSIFTATAKNGNGFNQTRDLAFAKYREGYENDYEVIGVKENAYSTSTIEEPTYIYHKPMNWGSFYAPLGSALHTPDRAGNMIGISMKGEKGKRFSQELIDSILDLLKTIKQSRNLKEIAIEAIPVFKAFKETADRFQDPGSSLTAQRMIDEYQEIIDSHASVTDQEKS